MKPILFYAVVLGGLFFSPPTDAKVNIAVIAPLNGDKAEVGTEIAAGAEAAVNEINQSGGLLGKKLNLITIEDECNDSLAVSSAQMMALNKDGPYKVSAVIGPYCFNKFNTVADTFAQAGIFQIIPTAVNSVYAESSHGGLIKMVGYEEQQAQDFFHYYTKVAEQAKVAVIFDNKNSATAEAVYQKFEAADKTDKILLYNLNGQLFDYNIIAKQLFEDGGQLALILGSMETVSYMAKEIKSRKHKFPIFVNKYQVMPEYFTILGKLADYTYFISLPTLIDSPEFAETLVKMRLLGTEPKGLTVYGYSAVRLWADLVLKARSFKYNDLSEALKGNSFNSGRGKLMFTNGSPSVPIQYSIEFYQNGEYTQVY